MVHPYVMEMLDKVLYEELLPKVERDRRRRQPVARARHPRQCFRTRRRGRVPTECRASPVPVTPNRPHRVPPARRRGHDGCDLPVGGVGW